MTTPSITGFSPAEQQQIEALRKRLAVFTDFVFSVRQMSYGWLNSPAELQLSIFDLEDRLHQQLNTFLLGDGVSPLRDDVTGVTVSIADTDFGPEVSMALAESCISMTAGLEENGDVFVVPFVDEVTGKPTPIGTAPYSTVAA